MFADVLTNMTVVLQQQTSILARLAATQRTVAPSLTSSETKAAPGTLSENQMAKLLALSGLEWNEQDELPTVWADFLAEPNKTAKLSFLQTTFSYDNTNDVDINIQITHQHVKDLESLSFGRGCNLVWENSHEGMSPTNCIPLTEEAARRRDAEEEARLHATSTTIKDYKTKKENIPKLRLVPEALIKMTKNFNFFIAMFFGSNCAFLVVMIDLEKQIKRGHAQGVMYDEESILGMYFAIFKEARLFFGTTFSKAELTKPKDTRKTIPSHVMPAALQGIKSGVLSRRQDITPDFRREYPTTQYANMTRTWESPTEQGREQQGNNAGNGNRENRTTPGGQLRFQVHERIRQTIRPILQRFQGRININSLLAHANTNAERLLGQQHQNTCLRALIIGACHRDCRRTHFDNPHPQLMRSIVEGIEPGVQRYIQHGPQRRS